MSWINAATTKLISYDIDNKLFNSIKAKTNAFRKVNCSHEREVILDKKNTKVIIKDLIVNNDVVPKKADYYLHLHPAVELKKSENNYILQINQSNIMLSFSASETIKPYVVEGDKQKPLGWYAEKFDKKVPAKTIVIPIKINQNFELQTVINYAKI